MLLARLYHWAPTVVLAGFLCGALFSCTTSPQAPGRTVEKVFVTDQKAVEVLAPMDIPGGPEVIQSLKGTFGNQSYEAQVIVEADRSRISMDAVNIFGAQLYHLGFDGRNLTVKSNYFGTGFKLEYMLFDFQLCYYPAKTLGAPLEKAGLRFEVRDSVGGWTREVWDGDTLVLTVSRQGTNLTYKNLLRHYEYTIQEVP